MRFVCFGGFIFFLSFLGAEIRECASTQEILEEIQPETLFIFDIDNTLIHPFQMLGSDEWVEYSIKKKREEGVSPKEVTRSVLELWAAVQVLSRVRLIEKETPDVIKKLQEKGFLVMGLTTRTDNVICTTRLQLQSVSIDLTKSSIIKEDFSLNEIPSAHFVDGILFASGKKKGDVLSAFFRQIGFIPKRIVFIDDKISCLTSVACVEKYGIEYLGLRYNQADPIVCAFDPEQAEAELEKLKKSLYNESL